MTSEDSNAGVTRGVPAGDIDYAVDNALWCATANAQDGYLTDRTFMESFESAIGYHWPELLKLWGPEPDAVDEETEATEQGGLDAFA